MFGDTMSDIGAALANGIPRILIRVPAQENREIIIAGMRQKIDRFMQNQGDQLIGLRNRKGIEPTIIFLESWNQVSMFKSRDPSAASSYEILNEGQSGSKGNSNQVAEGATGLGVSFSIGSHGDVGVNLDSKYTMSLRVPLGGVDIGNTRDPFVFGVSADKSGGGFA
jgi:hypothetical protein